MKWQELNAILLGILASGGVITLAILFGGLGELAGVNVTYHSPDQVCQNCTAEIHINSTYWEICFEHSNKQDVIYKKQSRSRRLWVNLNKIVFTDPPVITGVLVPTVKRYATTTYGGTYLRPLKDGDCIKRYSKKNHPQINKIFIQGSPDGKRVKWGVPFLGVDPDWIGWKVRYEEIPYKAEVYKEVSIPYIKFEKLKTMCSLSACASKENWCNSTDSYCYGNVTYYKKTRVFDHYETKYRDGERIGIEIGGKNYSNNNNVISDELIHWTVPVGERNFEEYGNCRAYEKAKGVCGKSKIT